jgi:hypothetical protein
VLAAAFTGTDRHDGQATSTIIKLELNSSARAKGVAFIWRPAANSKPGRGARTAFDHQESSASSAARAFSCRTQDDSGLMAGARPANAPAATMVGRAPRSSPEFISIHSRTKTTFLPGRRANSGGVAPAHPSPRFGLRQPPTATTADALGAPKTIDVYTFVSLDGSLQTHQRCDWPARRLCEQIDSSECAASVDLHAWN